jgi:hypothetical protein
VSEFEILFPYFEPMFFFVFSLLSQRYACPIKSPTPITKADSNPKTWPTRQYQKDNTFRQACDKENGKQRDHPTRRKMKNLFEECRWWINEGKGSAEAGEGSILDYVSGREMMG